MDDFLAFFDGPAFADNPDWADCYCWFPYHDAADGDFDERGAAANRAAMAQAIRAGRAEGYLAYAGGAVIGWVNAAPRAWFPQLAGLPGDSESIGATPCRRSRLASPGYRPPAAGGRHRGSASGRHDAHGSRSHTAPQNDAHRYHGTIELYESAGFERVTDLPGGVTLMQREL